MSEIIHPKPESARALQQDSEAGTELCFTCSDCPAACPVFMSTDRFSPMKLVRMANYGLLDDLIRLPQVWYCLQCNGCVQGCPMKVKPSTLIACIRREAVRCGAIDLDWPVRYRAVLVRLQRARWRLAAESLRGHETAVTRANWLEWTGNPVPSRRDRIILKTHTSFKKGNGNSGQPDPAACYTCRECSSACPVYVEEGLFDLVRIFRLYNYGIIEELLSSPQIWLCYPCQRCTETCSQGVKGHAVMAHLQELAVDLDYVDRDFPERWRHAQRELTPWVINEVDQSFNGRGGAH